MKIEKKSSSKGLILVIVILGFVVVGLVGFLLYDKKIVINKAQVGGEIKAYTQNVGIC